MKVAQAAENRRLEGGMGSPEMWDCSLFDESWTRDGLTNRLMLMVKDSTTLFAYWRVNDARKRLISKHFQSDWTHLPLFLQLYDVTDRQFEGEEMCAVHKIAVGPHIDNWYIPQVTPGRNYIVDLGTSTWTSRFFAILRSNVLEVPPSMEFRDPTDHVQFAPRFRAQAARGCAQESALDERMNQRELTYKSRPFCFPYESEFDGYSVIEQNGKVSQS